MKTAVLLTIHSAGTARHVLVDDCRIADMLWARWTQRRSDLRKPLGCADYTTVARAEPRRRLTPAECLAALDAASEKEMTR